MANQSKKKTKSTKKIASSIKGNLKRPIAKPVVDPHKQSRESTSASKKQDPRITVKKTTIKKKPSIVRQKKNITGINKNKFNDHYQTKEERRGKSDNLNPSSAFMSMGEHFEALRWHIMRSIIYIVVFSVFAGLFYQQIWELVMGPMAKIIEVANSKGIEVKTMTTKISDGFLIKFKVLIMFGVMLAIPAIIMEMWGFVVPALNKSLKKWGILIIIAAVLLFWGGAAFSRFGVWPMVNEFLVFEWQLPAIQTATMTIRPPLYLTISEYLSFFFSFHFAFGAAFQLPIISVILGFMGIVKWGLFVKSWRGAIVVIAILSATITPPDAFSMVAIMLPLTFLYFLSAFLVWLIQHNKDKVSNESV